MKFDTQAFPYPVLTPINQGDDYVDGSFECVLSFSQEISENGKLDIEYLNMLSVEELADLIDKKEAFFALEIRCPETFFRKVIKLDSRGVLQLNANEFHGKVTFIPQIIAHKVINHYESIDINPEFAGTTFDLKPGDILAIDNVVDRYIDFVPLKIETLVKIRTNLSLPDYSYEFNQTPSFIYIDMGEKLRNIWTEISKNNGTQPFFAMSIFKDCLVYAIERIIVDEDCVDYRWANSLVLKLGENDLLLPKEFEFNCVNLIAQKLVERVGISALAKSENL